MRSNESRKSWLASAFRNFGILGTTFQVIVAAGAVVMFALALYLLYRVFSQMDFSNSEFKAFAQGFLYLLAILISFLIAAVFAWLISFFIKLIKDNFRPPRDPFSPPTSIPLGPPGLRITENESGKMLPPGPIVDGTIEE